MPNVSSEIADALAPLISMLSADGYALELREESREVLVAEIKLLPDACAECLVPKEIMRAQFESALRNALAIDPPEIRLIYPAD
jgi:hypothetical protein